MNEIYVVMGGVGEYSDHAEWPVAWYPTREEADRHANRCIDVAFRQRRATEEFDASKEGRRLHAAIWEDGGVHYKEAACHLLERRQQFTAVSPELKALDPQCDDIESDWFVVEVPRGTP